MVQVTDWLSERLFALNIAPILLCIMVIAVAATSLVNIIDAADVSNYWQLQVHHN